MLASTARDLPERQRTLNGAIAWSWDLLNANEKRLFGRLAVFVGGAMLRQIEEVGGETDALDVLSSLVGQSLVRESGIEGEPRFRILVTIRESALLRLAESGEAEEISRRRASAYLKLAEEARPHFGGGDQKRWLDLVDLEHDNMRAALEWTISRGQAEDASRLVFALWRFWQRRGHLAEGANWSDRVLSLPAENVPPLVRLRAFEAAGGLVYWRADFDRATALYSKQLEIAEGIGDPAEEANAAYNLAFPLGLPLKDA